MLNEPDGARTWLPSNDHPSDKATFDFTIHTAPGVTGVANGALVEHTTTADGETWRWREDQPMATYLTQVLTGDYELVDGTGPDGLPLSSAVLRSELARVQPSLDAIGEQIEVLEQFFGPYPLDRYGIAVTDSAPGLAMETQGRSLFSKDDPQRATSSRSTSWPTSGSATRSPRRAGRTCGSTSRSPRTPSGCGASTRAG